MQIGLALPNLPPLNARGPMLRIARAAEDLGFASLWTSEHVVAPAAMFEEFGRSLDSLTTLAAVAAVTERIRLGTSVLILPLHEPFLLAKQVASLQNLSEGRFELGIGAGWLAEEFAITGADFDGRGRTTDEYLTILRHLLSGDPPTASGSEPALPAQLEGVRMGPLTDPVPVLVGGHSAPALHRAARYGDGWHGVWVEPDDLPRYIDATRGRSRRTPFRISVRVDVRLLDAGSLRWGLVGPVPAVIDQIRRYRAAGVDELVLDPMDRDDHSVPDEDQVLALLHRLHDEVLPALDGVSGRGRPSA